MTIHWQLESSTFFRWHFCHFLRGDLTVISEPSSSEADVVVELFSLLDEKPMDSIM